MFYFAVVLFPLISVICGVVAFVATVRFVAALRRDITRPNV